MMCTPSQELNRYYCYINLSACPENFKQISNSIIIIIIIIIRNKKKKEKKKRNNSENNK